MRILIFLLLINITNSITRNVINHDSDVASSLNCSIQTIRNKKFKCHGKDITINVPKTTKDFCLEKCKKMNKNRAESCMSILYKSKRKCVLKSCHPKYPKRGSGIASIKKIETKNKVISINCTGTDNFISPSNIPRSYPSLIHRYNEIEADDKRCQVVVPRINTIFRNITNFGGTIEDCVRECTHDGRCSGIIYSYVDNICIKGTNIELTDDTDEWKRRSNKNYIYMINRKTIPFRQGKCANYNKNSCNTDKECRLNYGRQGYNVEVKFNGAFCGRYSCKKK